MKLKILAAIFSLLFIIIPICQSQEKFLYSEIQLNVKDPNGIKFLHTQNFNNEQTYGLLYSPRKPVDIPWYAAIDIGPVFRILKYQKWNGALSAVEDHEKRFIGILIAPEISLNWRWLNFRIRNEYQARYDFEFDTNLLTVKFRGYPHPNFHFEANYSTFDFGTLEDVRTRGVSSELRLRGMVKIGEMIEIGPQITRAYYQSRIWKGELRPKAGAFLRLNHSPYWLELSWDNLVKTEKDRRSNKVFPEESETRILIAAGYSNVNVKESFK